MTSWKIDRALEDSAHLDTLLKEGWQPFAVVYKPNYKSAPPWIYLRKEVKNDPL